MTEKYLQNFEYYKISICIYLEVFSSELSIKSYWGLFLRVYVFTYINYLVNFVFDTHFIDYPNCNQICRNPLSPPLSTIDSARKHQHRE